MSPCVASFPPRWSRHPQTTEQAPFWACFAQGKTERFCGRFSRFSRVENQAGERVGAFVGTRLGSQRTATPTAQGFLRVSRPIIIRCRKLGLVGYAGCQIITKSPYCKDKSRCQARCQIKKGWFAHWITNRNKKKR